MTCAECGQRVTAGLLVSGGYLLRPCGHVARVNIDVTDYVRAIGRG